LKVLKNKVTKFSFFSFESVEEQAHKI